MPDIKRRKAAQELAADRKTGSREVIHNLPRVADGFARALTKIVHVDIRRYGPLLDEDALLRKRWRIIGPKSTRADQLEARRTLARLLDVGHGRRVWHGALVYGLYEAGVVGNELLVLHPGTGEELTRLSFAPAFALRLLRKHGEERFHVALHVVTTGAAPALACSNTAAPCSMRLARSTATLCTPSNLRGSGVRRARGER